MKYAVGDIHGDWLRFCEIMNQLNLTDGDTVYFIGDVIDRGKDGIKILREIMNMPNAKMLMGNHEYMMLMSLDISIDKWDRFFNMRLWYANGGDITHEEFLKLSSNDRKHILKYITHLPLTITTIANHKRYKLMHAAPPEMFQPGEKYLTATEFAVWKRIDAKTKLPKGYTYIFGHTTTSHFTPLSDEMRIWYGDKRINIDCGCGYPCGFHDLTGYLACLRLDDMKEFYSSPKTN